MTPDGYEGARQIGAYTERSQYEERPIGSSAPGGGRALEGILHGRQRSLERLAESVTGLVSERQRLSEEVLAGIDHDDLDLANLILSLYRPGQAMTDNPLYSKLRIERMRLGRERRQEVVSCWRDTALLGKDVAELAGKVEGATLTNQLLRGEK